MAVVKVQQSYYRAARDHLRRVEASAHISPDQRLDTTATLGDRTRLISVNQLINLLPIAVATADAVGVVLIVLR